MVYLFVVIQIYNKFSGFLLFFTIIYNLSLEMSDEPLKGLENVAKLKDNKYLKEQMDTDTWKRFEKSMEALEERLEKME